MVTKNLKYYSEPRLTFGNGQVAEDPRDGLMLFGPNEKFSQTSLKAGVVGTLEGIELYKSFVKKLQSPIISMKKMYGNEIENRSSKTKFCWF